MTTTDEITAWADAPAPCVGCGQPVRRVEMDEDAFIHPADSGAFLHVWPDSSYFMRCCDCDWEHDGSNPEKPPWGPYPTRAQRDPEGMALLVQFIAERDAARAEVERLRPLALVPMDKPPTKGVVALTFHPETGTLVAVTGDGNEGEAPFVVTGGEGWYAVNEKAAPFWRIPVEALEDR